MTTFRDYSFQDLGEVYILLGKEIANPGEMVVEMSQDDATEKIINLLQSLWKGISDVGMNDQ